MFDDETAAVKNEVGGGNLSAQNAMPRVYCVRINAVSPPMHQTDGREDK